MLRIEICEGKEAESKKWSHLPASTAQTLRLSEPWHGTGQIIVADSAFSSVTMAIELKKCGLLLTGVVKTTSREFPKEYLNDAFKYRHKGEVAFEPAGPSSLSQECAESTPYSSTQDSDSSSDDLPDSLALRKINKTLSSQEVSPFRKRYIHSQSLSGKSSLELSLSCVEE